MKKILLSIIAGALFANSASAYLGQATIQDQIDKKAGTNDTTWFDSKGSALAVTNHASIVRTNDTTWFDAKGLALAATNHASIVRTNDTTWFDPKGAALAVTNTLDPSARGFGRNLVFTNAAGAGFRLVVNSDTNGFLFVPQ